MGWANSSVRHPDELPDLGNLVEARGVVRADAIQRAIDPPERGPEGEPLRISNSREALLPPIRFQGSLLLYILHSRQSFWAEQSHRRQG